MMDALPEQAVDPRDADAPLALIEDIQCKADGSFLVTCNGYPFHATAAETPAVHAQILGMLQTGEPSTDYHEPQLSLDDPKSAERLWRDGQIERVKWLRERHRDQQELQYRHFKPTTEENWAGLRNGDNPHSEPVGLLYSEQDPKQTTHEAFQAGGAEAFRDTWYWSSSQRSAYSAFYVHFGDGYHLFYGKDDELRVRPVRSELIQ